ncbi:4-diphosphocytidyl-2-C-methyl-D-erythritol kinase [Spirochaetia bacterium]|nr:4-diphosphocytidyl-2-C-methyl-D-erythritol kinase [Spirochaetia bacterium]
MIQSRGEVTLHPPAKINLHLAVGPRRPDGFHGLDSIFAALDFADSLTISLHPRGGTDLTLKIEGTFAELHERGQIFAPIPAEENLVYRAAELFRAKTGFGGGIRAELIKRIPSGAGLGGGSSDAAAALLGLNALTGLLPQEQLPDLAAQLGSDIPFFIRLTETESPVWGAGGRGEILTALPPLPPLGVLLAFPGFASHTAAAYALLDAQSGTLRPKGLSRPKDDETNQWAPPENWNFYNDFEDIFLNYGTELEKTMYRAIFADLKRVGASFAALSGSGSACFGIFPSIKEAEAAEKKLKNALYTTKATFFLRPQKSGSTIMANLS